MILSDDKAPPEEAPVSDDGVGGNDRGGVEAASIHHRVAS